jgi:spore germination protein YaaH
MRRRGIVAVVALVVGSLLMPAAEARPAESPVKVLITGFFQAWQSTKLITRSAAALDTVGVDGVSITSSGAGVHEPDEAMVKAEYVAQHAGLRAEFLISNYDHGFSRSIAHKLLSSPQNIAKVAEKIAKYVDDQNWDGISVDLELLQKRDSLNFIRFLQALREQLSVGRSISVCISNSITSDEYLDRGYDLVGIAQNVDRIILMAYDQHGPWEHKPGPVGGLGWQRKGLNVMLEQVPAAQVDLGQAGYGYAWRPNGTHAVSDARARHLVKQDGATAHFDTKAGEWHAHLSDGSTIWWADARSLQIRLGVARAKGLHGAAVWDLGQSDPITQ